MKTIHKGYTIFADSQQHIAEKWTATLSIFNEDGELVVAPLKLDHDLVFSTPSLAERAAFLLAKYWIDGGDVEQSAA